MQFGSTEMDLGPTEMALPTLCNRLHILRSHRVCQSVTPRWIVNSLLPYCFTSVSPSLCNRSHRDLNCPQPLHFGSSELSVSVPPRFLKFISFTQFGATEISFRCHRVGSKVCNGWILCGGYLYPSTPSSFVERAIRNEHHSYLTFLRRELPTLVLRSCCSTPTI